MIKHFDIRVSGKVQGVFFRASAKSKADELGLFGVVKNELNGDVTIEAEGEENKLNSFLEWCKQGPPRAHVDKVTIIEGALKNFKGFFVLR